MIPTTWPALIARLRRQTRQRQIASRLLRWLRFNEVEVLPIGEYAVVYGYVELSNDLRARLRRIQQRQSLFRLAFDDPKVTRAMLRRQAEEFEGFIAAEVDASFLPASATESATPTTEGESK